LRGEGFVATTVVLKVRYQDFTTVTRSRTLADPISAARDFHHAATELLTRTDFATRPVRLLGIAAGGLIPAQAPRQLDLTAEPRHELDRAVESVRDRFGSAAVQPASLVAPRHERRDAPGPQ
jgi:DNA polymerase IV